MTQEEYNQLSYDYEHCAGTHCEKASLCLCHTAYAMLEISTKDIYSLESVCGNGCTFLQFLIAIPVMKCFGEESIGCYHIFTQHGII